MTKEEDCTVVRLSNDQGESDLKEGKFIQKPSNDSDLIKFGQNNKDLSKLTENTEELRHFVQDTIPNKFK